MLTLKILVPREQIKDHLDWVKQLIGICAAALGALVYKFDNPGPTPWQIKASGILFVLSMLSLFVAYTGFVGHQSRDNEALLKRVALSLFFGWATFILAFVAILARFLG